MNPSPIVSELARLRAQMRLLRAREVELLAKLAQEGEDSTKPGTAPRPGWPLRRLRQERDTACPA